MVPSQRWCRSSSGEPETRQRARVFAEILLHAAISLSAGRFRMGVRHCVGWCYWPKLGLTETAQALREGGGDIRVSMSVRLGVVFAQTKWLESLRRTPGGRWAPWGGSGSPASSSSPAMALPSFASCWDYGGVCKSAKERKGAMERLTVRLKEADESLGAAGEDGNAGGCR